jgi:hypothetical protein
MMLRLIIHLNESATRKDLSIGLEDQTSHSLAVGANVERRRPGGESGIQAPIRLEAAKAGYAPSAKVGERTGGQDLPQILDPQAVNGGICAAAECDIEAAIEVEPPQIAGCMATRTRKVTPDQELVTRLQSEGPDGDEAIGVLYSGSECINGLGKDRPRKQSGKA